MALTILVQHSNRELREHAAAVLEAAGMAVRQASDGTQGLAALETAPVDVILTGINMPQLDGFGFIEAVRGRDRLRAIPILVMAVSATPELKTRARNAGAAGWLPHPLDPARLVETVRIVTA
ncbi:response regulator [Paracoccus sp. PXZ]|uniref:response regulator n=1 Tax=Paracoccus sp. MKU1 TaxID=1745182 RepID=UPI0007191722|nr:response regulator [Paracoccus sp. MKU1]KRW93215.1 hypothetical protein AQY21_25475 [Paracoccus sp. MKU1]